MGFAWVLALVLCAGASASTSGRIAGGLPAPIEKYPSLVQVEFQNPLSGVWDQSCAGSIITVRFILSAAQCFDGIFYAPQYRRIRAGTARRNTGGIVAYVERAINHPFYGLLNRHEADINVVRLTTALVLSPAIQRATIVAQGTVVDGDMHVVHVGWGVTRQTDLFLSNELRDVNVFTVSNSVCAERYAALVDRPAITNNMICSGLLDIGGRDACQGDYGGPMFFRNLTMGVVSWGESCGNATYPRVNTNVGAYTDWIIQTVQTSF